MGAGKICFMLRFPVDAVAGITPFNAPVNLACHKIASAIAAGNTLVLKAPPQSPGVIHELARIFIETGTLAGVLNVLYGESIGPALVRDTNGVTIVHEDANIADANRHFHQVDGTGDPRRPQYPHRRGHPER